jgi:hypothetical protein
MVTLAPSRRTSQGRGGTIRHHVAGSNWPQAAPRFTARTLLGRRQATRQHTVRPHTKAVRACGNSPRLGDKARSRWLPAAHMRTRRACRPQGSRPSLWDGTRGARRLACCESVGGFSRSAPRLAG